MVRLKDIAERAGVSVMTVSKVLRDAPDISAATKLRVRKLATDMGYVPDSLARGLRSRESRLFGLVIAATVNPVFARMVMAIEELAHEKGFDVVLAHTLNQSEREEVVIRRLLSRRVDGLFLSPVYRLEPDASIYQELLQRKVPTILINHAAPFCQGFPSIATDDVNASLSATRHLLELGHRRIACFAGSSHAPAARERLQGYRKALQDAGIEPDDRLVFKAGNTIEEGEKAALQMVQEDTGATAVQAYNDLVAIGACNVFLNQGFRIPQDLSVVGFGNILICEHARVPLTTIRQPKFRLGVVAMEMMSRLLAGKPVDSKRLPAELVARQSTGPKAK